MMLDKEGWFMSTHRRPDPPDSPQSEWGEVEQQLNRIEKLLMTVNTNQAHLDADVTALTTAISTAVTELKAAIAAGTPAAALDFTALDALAVSTTAEAAADAPVAPPAPPVVAP